MEKKLVLIYYAICRLIGIKFIYDFYYNYDRKYYQIRHNFSKFLDGDITYEECVNNAKSIKWFGDFGYEKVDLSIYKGSISHYCKKHNVDYDILKTKFGTDYINIIGDISFMKYVIDICDFIIDLRIFVPYIKYLRIDDHMMVYIESSLRFYELDKIEDIYKYIICRDKRLERMYLNLVDKHVPHHIRHKFICDIDKIEYDEEFIGDYEFKYEFNFRYKYE